MNNYEKAANEEHMLKRVLRLFTPGKTDVFCTKRMFT